MKGNLRGSRGGRGGRRPGTGNQVRGIHAETGIERGTFALEKNSVVGRTRNGSLRRWCRSLNENTRPQPFVVRRLQFPIFGLAEAVVVVVVIVVVTSARFANDRERVVERVACACRGCPDCCRGRGGATKPGRRGGRDGKHGCGRLRELQKRRELVSNYGPAIEIRQKTQGALSSPPALCCESRASRRRSRRQSR